MRARFYVFVFLALSWAPLFGGSLGAQDDDPGGRDGINAQLFGQGNRIRGVITAVAKDNLTLRTDEGDTYKVFYSPNTRLVKDGQPIEASKIKLGDMVIAAGQLDAKAKTVGAVVLLDIDAEEIRKAKQDFGKTWIAGKVTAIHELKITVERMDNKQPQTIAVDENTSFRSHHEMITLGDIKVGDFISARGALQSNIFVAAILNVMGPKAGNFFSLPPGL